MGYRILEILPVSREHTSSLWKDQRCKNTMKGAPTCITELYLRNGFGRPRLEYDRQRCVDRQCSLKNSTFWASHLSHMYRGRSDRAYEQSRIKHSETGKLVPWLKHHCLSFIRNPASRFIKSMVGRLKANEKIVSWFKPIGPEWKTTIWYNLIGLALSQPPPPFHSLNGWRHLLTLVLVVGLLPGIIDEQLGHVNCPNAIYRIPTAAKRIYTSANSCGRDIRGDNHSSNSFHKQS